MSRPRFLADNDLNEHIVTGFSRREPGAEFIRAREIGLRNRSDLDVLAYAAAGGLIVVSHDVSTMPRHAYERLTQGLPMTGLLMVKQTDPVGLIIEDLLLIWLSSEAEEWNGQVAFLPL